MMLMKTVSSSQLGAIGHRIGTRNITHGPDGQSEIPAMAIDMRERYYRPFMGADAPSDSVLDSTPFVLARADYGHGEIFQSILPNAQANAYQELLDAGAGIFSRDPAQEPAGHFA